MTLVSLATLAIPAVMAGKERKVTGESVRQDRERKEIQVGFVLINFIYICLYVYLCMCKGVCEYACK